MGFLGEGIGQGRSGVLDSSSLRTGYRLRSMQVSEGDVVESLENPGGNIADSSHADITFGITCLTPGHEGMADDHRPDPGPTIQVLADAMQDFAQNCLMRAVDIQVPMVQVRVKEGNAIDGYPFGFEQDGTVRILPRRADVDTCAFEQWASEAQPSR